VSGVNNRYFYTNSTAAETNIGGVGLGSTATWLSLNQGNTTSTNGNGQTFTMTFSKPIYCAYFYVADVDGDSDSVGQYKDKVRATGFTASTVSPSSTISVSGDTATATTFTQLSASSSLGTVKFSYTGSAGLTSFTFSYTNNVATATPRPQFVLVSPIYFKTSAACC